MEGLSFESLNPSHFQAIHGWFNTPHVQKFYSLRSWTFEEVQKKLLPCVQGAKHMKCFVIFHSKQPIGYIQSYPLKDHPWEDQDLPHEILENAAGIDLFIGEESFLGKGMGHMAVTRFLETWIWPFYQYCLADPDIQNKASIRLFQKSGFSKHKQIMSKDALQRPVILQLFIKNRESFSQV
jgi:aminoglycoside 6'-N-acetyltransferase